MIVGLLVLTLLVVREVARAVDRDSPAARALGRMLAPAAIGLAAVMALQIVELVVGRA